MGTMKRAVVTGIAMAVVAVVAVVPGPVTGQSTEQAPTYRRTGAGFATGVVVGGLVSSGLLTGDRAWGTCTGSGDYLTACRLFWAGGALGGGAVGALLGAVVTSTTPPGSGTRIAWGAGLGSIAGFFVTLPLCDPYGRGSVLCDRSGMATVAAVGLGAVTGALVAHVTRPSRASSLSLVPTVGLGGEMGMAGRIGLGGF